MAKQIIKKLLPYLLILGFGLTVVGPFFKPGFFSFHDRTQVVRVNQMKKAFGVGQFPVRWVAGLGYGYGYPIFNFYAPLPYYVGSLFNLVGFSAIVSTKIMMALPLILSGITMYFWAKKSWGRLGGVLSALFYVFAPYKALDIYVRGAVGEVWAMVFLPLVFLSFSSFFSKKHPNKAPLGGAKGGLLAFSLAGLVLSHNILAMLTGLTLCLIFVFNLIFKKISKVRLVSLLVFSFLGLALASFFWLPAIKEAKYTKVARLSQGTNNFSHHFVFLDQLWSSNWGFGGSAPGRVDGMSFKLGKLHILTSLISITGLLVLKKKPKLSSIFSVSILPLAVSILMMLPISFLVWKNLPYLDFAQYPWRFLAISTLTVSFLSGGITSLTKSKLQKLAVFTGLIILLIYFNLKLFKPQDIFPASDKDYLSQENITWHTSKISDEYLPKNFPVPQSQDEVKTKKFVSSYPDDTQIKVLRSDPGSYQIKVNTTAKQDQITAHIAKFPGWKVWVNHQEVEINEKNGFISFPVNYGKSLVELKLTNTTIRTISNLISLFSLIILFGLKYYQERQKSD